MTRFAMLAALSSLATATGCQLVLGIEDTPDAEKVSTHVVAEGVIAGVDLRLRSGDVDETITIAADGTDDFSAQIYQGTTYDVSLVGAPPCVLGATASGTATADIMVELTCAGATQLTALALTSPTGQQPTLVAGTFMYAMTVSELQQLTRVTATPRSTSATLAIQGQAATAGVASAPITLTPGANTVTIVVDHPAGPALRSTYIVSVARAATLVEAYYGKAYAPSDFDDFGYAVAIDGDVMVVADVNQNSAVDPTDPGDLAAPQSGAAFIFRRTGGAWAHDGWLKAPNVDNADIFGSGVAISGDRIVVGAQLEDSGSTTDMTDDSVLNSGAAYVYRHDGSGWVFEAYLKAPVPRADARFGNAVAIDGDTIAVGAFQDTDVTAVSGAVYVYRRTGTTWAPEGTLHADVSNGAGRLGQSVAISGDIVAAGAYAGSGTLASSGIVRIYQRTGTTWAFDEQVEADTPLLAEDFGFAVGLSNGVLVVGAPATTIATAPGAAYVYRETAGTWVFEQKLEAGNKDNDDEYGTCVAIWGDTIAVGAWREDGPAAGIDPSTRTNGSTDSGAAYAYHHGVSWVQQHYLKASVPDASDGFGSSLAMSGDTLIVGAGGEASRSPTDPTNDAGTSVGAIYVFH
jgi:hypothetical protein